QLICFGSGILVGVPLFFLIRSKVSVSAASISMILVMVPFFLLAMYEKNGLPLEKILRNIFRVYFLRPKRRPYETNNFYAVLERQEKLDEEVKQIVQKANTRGQKSNRGRNRKGEAAGR
ncbi:MAG TPA: PrgI family protein, partial [Candidatus Limiplasma sp.]|nr:PrgI family protein [Candidatus Limiplasma sp.]